MDRWLVIKLPKENKNKFSMDLIDSQADEGKELGRLTLTCRSKDLLKMRDEGRSSRLSRKTSLAASWKMKIVGRKKSSKRKPGPKSETLRRSKGPGSYSSWNQKGDAKPDAVDRLIQEQQ